MASSTAPTPSTPAPQEPLIGLSDISAMPMDLREKLLQHFCETTRDPVKARAALQAEPPMPLAEMNANAPEGRRLVIRALSRLGDVALLGEALEGASAQTAALRDLATRPVMHFERFELGDALCLCYARKNLVAAGILLDFAQAKLERKEWAQTGVGISVINFRGSVAVKLKEGGEVLRNALDYCTELDTDARLDQLVGSEPTLMSLIGEDTQLSGQPRQTRLRARIRSSDPERALKGLEQLARALASDARQKREPAALSADLLSDAFCSVSQESRARAREILGPARWAGWALPLTQQKLMVGRLVTMGRAQAVDAIELTRELMIKKNAQASLAAEFRRVESLPSSEGTLMMRIFKKEPRAQTFDAVCDFLDAMQPGFAKELLMQKDWVWSDSSTRSRKKGDFLGFCVVQGFGELARHAMERFPELPKLAARDAVSYMVSKNAKGADQVFSGWENLLISAEAAKVLSRAPQIEEPAPARSKRL